MDLVLFHKRGFDHYFSKLFINCMQYEVPKLLLCYCGFLQEKIDCMHANMKYWLSKNGRYKNKERR